MYIYMCIYIHDMDNIEGNHMMPKIFHDISNKSEKPGEFSGNSSPSSIAQQPLPSSSKVCHSSSSKAGT